MTRLTTLSLTSFVVAAATLPSAAQDASPTALIEALQGGGHVLYIRHGQTESDYADQVVAEPANCATQRVLSRMGWQQSLAIGQAVEAQGIPVGEVLSSQYCRAWQTAALAFGTYAETAALNFEPAEEYTDAQFAAMRDRVLPLIVAPIPAGENRVIVGHDDPFEAVTGIYPEPQGVTYVLRVEGEAFEVLGAIPPDGWPTE